MKISLDIIITVILVILKLSNVITWTWFGVFTPLIVINVFVSLYLIWTKL